MTKTGQPAPSSPLTRSGITGQLESRLGLSGREAGEFLESFLEIVSSQLEKGGSVTISGLGRFGVKDYVSRKGRDLVTGQIVQIPGGRRPVFTLSRSLRTIIKRNPNQA